VQTDISFLGDIDPQEQRMSTVPSRVLARLTYANLVSTAALVLALGTGTAYAANTIGSSDLIDGDVQHVDLAADAVAGDRIANGTVGRADLAPDADAVAGDRVVDGSIALADLSGIEVQSTVSVPAKAIKPGRCAVLTIGATGARAGQLVALSPVGKLPKGIVLSGRGVMRNDTVELSVCNLDRRPSKALGAVPVRVVTFS
jgi:hypothetical protein